ncbi:MAG: citrate/2-methylcitrate synthase, partial [Wenzhouxiangellaceae bacterium]
MSNKKTGAGLRGQSAGETAICTVGASGNSLRYRGYDVDDLAENASFNEVAHLIFKGELPDRDTLEAYSERLKGMRTLPDPLKEVLERIPAGTHPMDVMRTGCSFLGNIEPEHDFSRQQDVADRLLATFPAMITYWYRFSHDGVRIETESDEDGIGAHFLALLHGKSPNELHAR